MLSIMVFGILFFIFLSLLLTISTLIDIEQYGPLFIVPMIISIGLITWFQQSSSSEELSKISTQYPIQIITDPLTMQQYAIIIKNGTIERVDQYGQFQVGDFITIHEYQGDWRKGIWWSGYTQYGVSK